MVIAVSEIKNKRRNYFMTKEEATTLWKYSGKLGSKFQIMVGLALFRGLRIGEICACNLYDFRTADFANLNVILEKSHIKDTFPLLKEFSGLLKEYVLKNRHLMRDGYLFPFYSSARHKHINTKTASTLFCRLRKIIGENHPSFLDSEPIVTPSGRKIIRYRIGFHSCRRWFETMIWDRHKDKMVIRDLMRYKDTRPVEIYIDPYENWKNEPSILEGVFGDIFRDAVLIKAGQTKLSSFFKKPGKSPFPPRIMRGISPGSEAV